MSIPLPGAPCRGSKTGKPIMALFDLLGRTWALGVVWQLSNNVLTFRELQEKCEMVSPTLLNTRLKELRAVGIVDKVAGGYQLTEIGNQLIALFYPLGEWSSKWQAHLVDKGIIDGKI